MNVKSHNNIAYNVMMSDNMPPKYSRIWHAWDAITTETFKKNVSSTEILIRLTDAPVFRVIIHVIL